MIKRMIQRQYDQLLEVCNQTKAEVEQLDRGLKDSDFVQRLEVEKMQELICSIENDVQFKKQELYNAEIKNRYQHLMGLYQQTNDEVRMLEATLDNNAAMGSLGNNLLPPVNHAPPQTPSNWLGDGGANQPPPQTPSSWSEDSMDSHAPPQSPSNWFHDDPVNQKTPVPPQIPDLLSGNTQPIPPSPPLLPKKNPSQKFLDSGTKRERLDLSVSTGPQRDESHYEMLKKWYESLDKIDELDEQEVIEEQAFTPPPPTPAPDMKPFEPPAPDPEPVPIPMSPILPEKEETVALMGAPEMPEQIPPYPGVQAPPVIQPPVSPIIPESPVIQTAPIVPEPPVIQAAPVMPEPPIIQTPPVMPEPPVIQAVPKIPVIPSARTTPDIPVAPMNLVTPDIPASPVVGAPPIMPIVPPQSAPVVPPMPVAQAAPDIPVAPVVLIPATNSTDKAGDRFGSSWSTSKKKTPTNKMNKGPSVIGASLNLMFYLILTSAILFVMFSGVYSPDGRPRDLAGYSVMRVATGSMVPELPINTLIVTRKVEPEVLEVNDIVTFLREDTATPTVTHRVHEIYENDHGIHGFRLMGDANDVPDPYVDEPEDLVGRVVMSSYSIGRFLMFIHVHFLTIIKYALIVLIGLFLVKVVMSPKDKNEGRSSSEIDFPMNRSLGY